MDSELRRAFLPGRNRMHFFITAWHVSRSEEVLVLSFGPTTLLTRISP